MDYFIVAITTIAGLYFHWWLYVRIRRWMERDLALSMAAGDPAMQDYMLERLAEAKTRGMLEAEARHRHEAEQARRRADEAAAAAQRAEQARSDREDYDERARKAAEKKAEQEKKNAAGGKPAAADSLLPAK